jgi:hypothetical protein
MLHAPVGDESLSGSDYDCAVSELDPTWPLRLTGGWSLCQALHYDLLAWYWVLERDGQIFALDTLIDPDGLGRDALPTKLIFEGDERALSPAVRGAYLTSKRVRKGVLDEREWTRIGELARTDEPAFRDALRAIVGPQVAGIIGDAAVSGLPPDKRAWRRAHTLQLLRRFRTPGRALRGLALGFRRTVERVTYPTGLVVAITGPDGAGKSALARELPEACRGLFRRDSHFHWRPGVLPRPGSLLGRDVSDPSEPHGRDAHGRGASAVLLVYFWIDFVIGTWLRFSLPRRRSALVLVERGWWDIEADPLRYRLNPPPRLLRALGRLLPRPQIAFTLVGDADVLLDRKQELTRQEVERQLEYWRDASIAEVATCRLDANRPLAEVVATARDVIVSTLESQTASRVGSGWVNLPSRSDPRFFLPRGARRTAAAALAVHQPVSKRSRVGWIAARRVARVGGFRLLRRGAAPPLAVRRLVAPYVPPRGNIAVARLQHPNRYIVAILGPDGAPRLAAKVATEEAGACQIAAEAYALERVAPLLSPPLVAPRVVGYEHGVIVLEWCPWTQRRDVTEMPEDIAFALGQFFACGRDSDGLGPVHGDFAPWNVLQTRNGWFVLDWESASLNGRPFEDLSHFFVQAHVLLGRPSQDDIVEGFRDGTGAVGRAVRAYASGAGVPVDEAEHALRTYLDTSSEVLLQNGARERAIEQRKRLRSRLAG